MDNLEQKIRNEFVSYYLVDELPGQWSEDFLKEELPRMAQESAERLQWVIKNNQMDDLIALLSAASSNPNHSLIKTISDATLIDWGTERNDWPVLQSLLRQIVVNLEKGR